MYKSVNTTESFVHPSLHLFSHQDPAIHIILFLLITYIFEDLFVPQRMFTSVVINMFQLLVGLSCQFMMNKAYLLLILHRFKYCDQSRYSEQQGVETHTIK